MALRYILLDNDGTLMDFALAQQKALEEIYSKSFISALLPYSPFILDCYDKSNKSWWEKLEKGECTKTELQIGRFSDFFELIGIPGDPEEFNRQFMQALGAGQFLIDGAAEITGKLSQKYDIYIITNGIAETQHKRIDTCGYISSIKGIFVSEETGYAKPNREYFRYVLNSIGDLDPSHYIVIGDSLSSDILGAKNAGIECIWYNPAKEKNINSLPIKYEISSLGELEALLL